MGHAILSASGSKRWLTCTPSARLEQLFPDEQNSIYAQEGTLAHSLGELSLSYQLGKIAKAKYEKALAKIKTHELYESSMSDYIDIYVNYVLEQFNEAQKRSKDALVYLEQKLDFSEWVPEGFGTGDAIIIADQLMDIIDLKYGKGVEVESEDNTQMMLYALGALREFEFLYDIREVRMTIVQPRLDSIDSTILTVDELYTWAIEYLKPRAQMAWNGEGEFVSGDHCRWCKARFTCRARAEANLELAKYDFAPAELLSDDEISEVLSKAEELKKWIADIEEYTLNQALQGKKWPGFKLVEGRSNRKYVDDLLVAKKLLEAGYDETIIYEKKLLGITAMEKVIGKKNFGTLLGDLIEKPQGKPTLVPESDKRPELVLNSVENDFEKYEYEGEEKNG